jgi:hypothetical protein
MAVFVGQIHQPIRILLFKMLYTSKVLVACNQERVLYVSYVR